MLPRHTAFLIRQIVAVLPAYAAIVVFTASMPACAAEWPGDGVEKTVDLTIEHAPDTGVEVETTNGSITIEADDSLEQAVIEASIRARSDARLEQVAIVAQRREDGTLVVSAKTPQDWPLSNERVSFTIRTPDANGAAVRTHNGSVTLRNLRGEAIAETHNGSVHIERHAGQVQATTHNGRIACAGIEGPAVLSTHNGSVVASNMGGAVEATAHNGGVDVELAESAEGAVSLETRNGGVRASLSPRVGAVQMRTRNGGIALDVPAALNGTVRATSRRGAISFQDESGDEKTARSSMEITLGDGSGMECELTTSTGNVKVRVRD